MRRLMTGAAGAVVCAALLIPGSASGRPTCAWRSVPLPALRDARLLDVEVVSRNDVWAVGHKGDRSLIVHYDGRAVRVVSSPSPFRFENTLHGVSAAGPDDIWAVGEGVIQKEPNYVYVPLALHFDGRRWTHVPPPRIPSTFGGSLSAVAAVGSEDVWAVGQADGAAEQPPEWVGLTQRWEGQGWRIVEVPESQPYGAIDALGPNSVWAADYDFRVSRWDGSRWTHIRLSSRSNASGGGYGISARAANNVWVVGAWAAGPLVEHFDGRRFRKVPIPYSHFKSNYENEEDSFLGDVIAFSRNDVIAVGNFGIEHYNGRRWTKTSRVSSLAALDAVSRTNLWGVGSSYRRGADWPVVMRYSCA